MKITDSHYSCAIAAYDQQIICHKIEENYQRKKPLLKNTNNFNIFKERIHTLWEVGQVLLGFLMLTRNGRIITKFRYMYMAQMGSLENMIQHQERIY